MSHPAFREVGHRPWPVPQDRWLWSQTWNDLAFIHWRVPTSLLIGRVPAELEIDQFDGSAWIALTPFVISDATMRGIPALPGLSKFPETNVRTYVRHRDRPGVWFFSLDADSQLGVLGGRWLFELPYVYAEMKVRKGDGRIDYSLRRRSGERLDVNYAPTGPIERASAGSLEHFLTERYRLYAQSSAGRLYYADIHHVPWPLRPAHVELRQNDLLAANGLRADGAPIGHYAEQLHVAIWPLKAVVR